jgi:urease accessory protein
MIIEKTLGSLSAGSAGKRLDPLYFDWFERDKKLLHKTTLAGEEVGLRLSAPLNDGDVLYEDEERAIVAALLPCELIRVTAASWREMGLLCFELGNRHLSLAIVNACVTMPYDAPTYDYLQKRGFACERVTEKFTGFTQCRAHGESPAPGHSHEHRHG